MKLRQLLRKLKIITKRILLWNGSKNYWENRYIAGGNSGPGSYEELAVFKADVINSFVKEKNIKSVIEWGCGDGNQLSYSDYPSYIGIDVSKTAINICKKRFANDKSKVFIVDDGKEIGEKGELAISLDVIYHLVEDDVFEKYMFCLFASSTKYVCIYSSDFDEQVDIHVRCRKFTTWIEENITGWKLDRVIKNKYPYDGVNVRITSWSDFYLYSKY